MTRRTHQQWQSLIAAFEASGLTQTAFCQQHDLNPKYFSLKRGKLMTQKVSDRPVFSQAVVATPAPGAAMVTLQVGRVTVELSPSTSPDYLAQVIRSLA